jgi:hypothetical protein
MRPEAMSAIQSAGFPSARLDLPGGGVSGVLGPRG